MDPSIQRVSSSLQALQREYETIAHNMANASTTGYKRQRTVFADVLAQRMGNAAAGGQVQADTQVDFSQGPLTPTGRELDTALEGPGFFVLETPQGNLYTRNGSFHVGPERQLTDAAGRRFAGEAGQITLPEGGGAIVITPDGEVLADNQSIGRLRIVEFAEPGDLVPIGGGCFRSQAAAQQAANTTLRQGYQESSNVTIVEELVGLIAVSRLYEANLKSMQTQDERMKTILQVAMG